MDNNKASQTKQINNSSEKTAEQNVLAKTILLMGAPNVGKSIFFTYFTKVHVISSNYAGTTVSYMKGDFNLDQETCTMIDVPGTYSLASNNDAEKIAVDFLKGKPDGILFVMNASDLVGSIKLFLEVKQTNLPIVVALNLSDVAKRQGKSIDREALEKYLGVPVVQTIAVKADGFIELNQAMIDCFIFNKCEKAEVYPDISPRSDSNAKTKKADKITNKEAAMSKLQEVSKVSEISEISEVPEVSDVAVTKKESKELKKPDMKALWAEATVIVDDVVSYTSKSASRLDHFGQKLLKPWPGTLYAIIIILLSIAVVVGVGKVLRAVLLLPLVNDAIVPFFEKVFSALNVSGVLEGILIGEYGIFRIGFEWIIALILPYVLLFQLVFAFLEDSGILPRIAVLFDSLMSKVGVQGGSLINVMLGFGCSVPAIIGTRTASTKKERLVVSTVICFTIPCISQIGAIISLLGDYSIWLLVALIATGGILFIFSAKILSKIIPGRVTPMVIEVPHLLSPERKSFFLKFRARMKSFLLEAEGPMLIAVVLAALLTETGLLNGLSKFVEPVVSGWLGLPKEASLALILGVIRREMSVAPLLAMNLSPLQMFVGAVVSLLYIPCLSVIGILAEEFNLKTAVLIFLGTIFNAIFIGGLINQGAHLIMSFV